VTFFPYETWWWPYLFILIGGWLATDSWRFLGVYLGGRISDDAEILVLVRCIATGLVAALIGKLIVFPTGELAGSPTALRIGAAAVGFAAYLLLGRRIVLGIFAAEAVLLTGLWLG